MAVSSCPCCEVMLIGLPENPKQITSLYDNYCGVCERVFCELCRNEHPHTNPDGLDDWEQIILKYLTIVGIPLTIRYISKETLMPWLTCKKKLKALELKGKVKAVKKGTRIKYASTIQR